MSAREMKVDVESNTSGWNQTCKNLIRFLQDRISNKKKEEEKWQQHRQRQNEEEENFFIHSN
jgi:hypothetical protein